MASLFQALLGSLLLVLPVLPHYVHASEWKKVGYHAAVRGGARSDDKLHVVARNHRPRFVNGPWKHAHATFYEGGAGTFGMNNARSIACSLSFNKRSWPAGIRSSIIIIKSIINISVSILVL